MERYPDYDGLSVRSYHNGRLLPARQAGTLCTVLYYATWAILLLGGFQLFRVPRAIYRDEMAKAAASRRIPQSVKDKTVADAKAKVRERVRQSLQLGASYRPKRFYADLRFSRTLKFECEAKFAESHWEVRETEALGKLLMKNLNEGRFKQSEINGESMTFKHWLENGNPADRAEADRMIREWGWGGFFSWLLLGMLAGMFCMPVFSAYRFGGFKELREGYRQNPLRFWLSTIFWPYYIFVYPNNLVREMWVEVRIRQMGGLFRRLQPSEQQLIREVANSSAVDYRQWMRQTQRYAVYPLMLALLATMLCRFCVTASAQSAGHSDGCVQIHAAPSGPSAFWDSGHPDTGGGGNPGAQAISLPPAVSLTVAEPGPLHQMEDRFVREDRHPRKFDHVPLRQVVLSSIYLAGARTCAAL